jgi:hypothetical protein
MGRRPRRSGIRFIENDRDRNLTYFKRRAGLYKSASDLSTLTGAKVALVVQGESGKMSAYGTPTPDAIIDCFLSNSSPADMYVDEEEAARITRLQDELYELEQAKAVEEKRAKDTKARLKDLQETRVGNLVSDEDLKDLSVDELNVLLQKMARIEEDIAVRAHADRQLEVSAQQGAPSLPGPSSWPWVPQINNMPPRYAPWAPLHASSSSSSQHPKSPWQPLPQSTWSQSSLLPPAPAPPLHYQQRHMMPAPAPAPPPPPMHHQAHMMPPRAPPMHHQQAHMMPPPPANETHQYNNYYLPQQQPPPFPPQANPHQNYAYTQHFNPQAAPVQRHAYTQNFNFNPGAAPEQRHAYSQNLNFNPVAAPHQRHSYTQNFNFNPVPTPPAEQQQHANSLNFAADGQQPPHSYQWPPPSPGNEYHNHQFQAMYVQLGLVDDNGAQAAAGDQEGVPADPFNGLHIQGDDSLFDINLWDYSPLPGDNPGDAAGN